MMGNRLPKGSPIVALAHAAQVAFFSLLAYIAVREYNTHSSAYAASLLVLFVAAAAVSTVRLAQHFPGAIKGPASASDPASLKVVAVTTELAFLAVGALLFTFLFAYGPCLPRIIRHVLYASPLLVLGLCLTSWAIVHRPAGPPRIALCATGPYRYIRHPRFAGTILILCSLGLMVQRPHWLLPIAGVMLFIFVNAAAREEAYLAAHYGERYSEYVRLTGRIFPPLLRERPPIATPDCTHRNCRDRWLWKDLLETWMIPVLLVGLIMMKAMGRP